ncbi:MAG: hypothetical protein ABEK10_04675 [Candidatus Nanosalina sp.]
MDIDISPATFLYGISAFLGAITVIYFGSSLVFNLSPTTKSFAFFCSFLIFLAASLYLSKVNKIHAFISLGMTGISYVTFLVYTLGKFRITREGIFTSLFLSSLLFVGLGYMTNRERITVEKNHLKYLLATVVILGSLLTFFDLTGSQPSYRVNLENNATLQPGQEAVVGSLKIKNSFFLPREISAPSYSSCLGGADRKDIYVSIEVEKEVIPGEGIIRANMTVSVPPKRFMNNSETVEVQRSDGCPSDGKNSTLYIYQNEEDRIVEYFD